MKKLIMFLMLCLSMLAHALTGKVIKVVDIQQMDKDRYGRIVGKVYFNGKDINLYMLETGNAWYYKQYAKK